MLKADKDLAETFRLASSLVSNVLVLLLHLGMRWLRLAAEYPPDADHGMIISILCKYGAWSWGGHRSDKYLLLLGGVVLWLGSTVGLL